MSRKPIPGRRPSFDPRSPATLAPEPPEPRTIATIPSRVERLTKDALDVLARVRDIAERLDPSPAGEGREQGIPVPGGIVAAAHAEIDQLEQALRAINTEVSRVNFALG